MTPITILGFVAGALTTIAFLPQVIKSLREKRARDISLGFSLLNAGAGLFWLSYGLFTENWPLIIFVSISLVFGIAILFLKERYGIENKTTLITAVVWIISVAAIVVPLLIVFRALAATPTIVVFTGYTATVLAPLSFVSQVITTWRLKETKDISLPMYIIFWSGVVMWLSYGLLLKDGPIVINNIINLTLASIIMGFKLKYK